MVLLSVPSKTIQTGCQQWVFCELLIPSDHVSARSKSVVTLFLYGSGPLVVNRRSHYAMFTWCIRDPVTCFPCESMVCFTSSRCCFPCIDNSPSLAHCARK